MGREGGCDREVCVCVGGGDLILLFMLSVGYGQTTSVTCSRVSLWGRESGVNVGAPGADGGWGEWQKGVKG